MKKIFNYSILFSTIFILLLTCSILPVKAVVSGNSYNLNPDSNLTQKQIHTLSEIYMPHIDVLTPETIRNIPLPAANEYANMVVANVTDFVNIRTEPNTESGIAGRMYRDAVGKIIKFSPVDDTWLEISSGNVTGFVKAQYFLLGKDAAAAINTKITNGETLIYARSMEDILAEIAAKEEARRQKAREEAAAKAAERINASNNSPAVDNISTAATTELRQSIVDYALQYLGGPYVHGGNSLTKGTDCSGFTKLIFAEFGYALNRTPSGQLSSDGKKIEYSEIQPGDIICYTSNGKTCTHVALYIGDGLIIHAANSKKGIITNEADYSTIMGVKNILD